LTEGFIHSGFLPEEKGAFSRKKCLEELQGQKKLISERIAEMNLCIKNNLQEYYL